MCEVGYSNGRRFKAQITIGFVVDQTQFRLDVGRSDGAKGGTSIIVPMMKVFHDLHGAADIVVSEDARISAVKGLKGAR